MIEPTLQQRGRSCEVSGHQEHWQGYCFGFFLQEGKPTALVECNKSGSISYVDACKVKFIPDFEMEPK